MATIDHSRFGDLCRLCATKTTVVLGFNIFDSEGNIRQQIECCLPVQVHEADDLPKMVCENCVYKLDLFYDFRERCIRTERLLIDVLKEIHDEQTQQAINEVPMVQNDLIMVQHQNQLINVPNITNVTDLNLSLIKHEIILAQHNVDINNQSLANIQLNHHELTNQDLSNHSLQNQQMLVDTNDSHSLQASQYAESNLDLINEQHQLLSTQFRLQHDLHVSMTEASSVNDISLSENCNQVQIKEVIHNQENYQLSEDTNSLEKTTHRFTIHESSNSDENSLTVDSQISELQNHNYALQNGMSDINSIKHEDSNNSENSILMDDTLNGNHMSKSIFILPDNLEDGTRDLDNNKEWFCCNVCGKVYEERNEFDSHVVSHFHKCTICEDIFTSHDLLNTHRKEIHRIEDIQLPENENIKNLDTIRDDSLIGIESNSDSEGDIVDNDLTPEDDCKLFQEEETEDEQNTDTNGTKRKKPSPKVCKECGKSYKTNYKLTEHMRKHTGEKPYKCKSCEKAFRSKIGLAQHEAKHTGQYDYSCPICGKGFQCKSYLMVHQRVHSDLKPYPCTTCGRNFKTKQSLLDHVNRHLGVKPYMCDVCGRGFITKGLCKAHQKIHTGLDNRKYSCKICLKMFVSKSYLQTHMRIHTGEKPFICEVCGKGFLTRVDLKIHSTMHTGEKSFICEICGKAFARRDALRCHRRSHTGERPYSCDLCGQTFTQFTPMAIHKRLHTGERPYSCETCSKTFISRSTMMAHAKRHTNTNR